MGVIKEHQGFRGHTAYLQLVVLGTVLHISQTIIFWALSCPMLVIYNIASVIFYLGMIFLVQKKMYRLAVSLIHVEVCMFTIISTVFGGWGMGLPMYLLAISALVYFCPFEHKIISYMFSVGELVIFIFLRIFTYDAVPIYSHVPKEALTYIYMYSMVCCFFIVLFAAFSSNLSASVTYQQLRKENEALYSQASHDFLTGLLSRRAFLEKLDSMERDKPLVIALADIDDFKLINDSYGHNSGDDVLQAISNIIKSQPAEAFSACRWGGEEFVFLFNSQDLSLAHSRLLQLHNEIGSEKFLFGGKTVQITMTFGLYKGKPGEDVFSVIDHADELLYKGKASGKNQIVTS